MRIRWWRATGLLAAASMAVIYLAGITQLGEAEAEPARSVPPVSGDLDAQVAELLDDAPASGEAPSDVLAAAESDPETAAALVAAAPDPSDNSLAAAIAELDDGGGELDPVEVGTFFDDLGAANTAWLSVLYPSVIGELPGAPFEARADANRIVLTAATEASTEFDTPERPWTADAERPPRPELASLVDSDRDFLYLDPYNNTGDGSWVEAVGDLQEADNVAILVPGGSSVLSSENFDLYYQRAKSFVEAADGDLAVVVWAGASWPAGWVEESWASWSQVAAERLAAFTLDLRAQIGESVPVTLAGHSYGGAVSGLAETYDLGVDRVLHIASAGMGYDVYEPEELAEPCRPRYSITAPGDPISYVQGLPYVPLLGHGADPDDFPGVSTLSTGNLSDAPDAVDDHGVSLADQGTLGKEIEGVHSHSEVFYPDSDSWRNILSVMIGDEPELSGDQPAPLPDC